MNSDNWAFLDLFLQPYLDYSSVNAEVNEVHQGRVYSNSLKKRNQQRNLTLHTCLYAPLFYLFFHDGIITTQQCIIRTYITLDFYIEKKERGNHINKKIKGVLTTKLLLG